MKCRNISSPVGRSFHCKIRKSNRVALDSRGQSIQRSRRDYRALPGYLVPEAASTFNKKNKVNTLFHMLLRHGNPLSSRSEESQSRLRRHIHQAVTITGLGSSTFDRGIANLNQILLKFANNFPEDKLDAWNYTQFEESHAIRSSSRYFTERRLAPQETQMKFGKHVDPENILQKMMGHDFFHGPDNFVEYKKSNRSDGKTLWAYVLFLYNEDTDQNKTQILGHKSG